MHAIRPNRTMQDVLDAYFTPKDCSAMEDQEERSLDPMPINPHEPGSADWYEFCKTHIDPWFARNPPHPISDSEPEPPQKSRLIRLGLAVKQPPREKGSRHRPSSIRQVNELLDLTEEAVRRVRRLELGLVACLLASALTIALVSLRLLP